MNELELYSIFSMTMGNTTYVARQIIERINGLKTRLDIISDAIKSSPAQKRAGKFAEIRQDISKCSNARAAIAHTCWIAHPKYPDSLIRIDAVHHPDKKPLIYKKRDFVEMENKMKNLNAALTELSFEIGFDIQQARERASQRELRLRPD
ncbi:hypothetical protein [Marinivivus vitaminiproducens]|uniref:hypothetical protein n=1 Tax=Marinivivus vitaminiproducens TaxID=3035935 RepID=UPI0027A25298|nr:hypothetical protein P4R82_08140 [Geminicoccaceae bacterium SCSIO 64248]